MRLHSLSITAFGPFADTAVVDFEELSAAGLFLLTGATGAGKTSVLDAVCFALYGQVPGDRAGAKHLRSDHASPQQAPEVVLRMSVGDREFTFTRSPSWMRPKLRGTGETKVQAHVLVEERRHGAWTVLTNRLDDAGLLVTELLGMSCTQFTQVAMLPQGRFQAFLRASSAERHAVLQQLFRTDRFERIESWLLDRRTTARRASEAVGDEVLETVNRLREATGSSADPGWLDDLAGATDSGLLPRWVDDLATAAAEAEELAQTSSAQAEEQLALITAEVSEAERTTALRERGAAAQAELAVFATRADDLAGLRCRLETHQRAAPLTGLASTSTAAQAAAELASARWAQQRARVAPLLPDDFSDDDLSAGLRAAQDAHALAVAFAPRARARQDGRERLATLTTRLQEIEAGVAELELTLADQPGFISDAVAAVHEARAAAARHPLVQAGAERLEAAVAAARRAELVGLELAAARTDVLSATAVAQQARESYLDLREVRINGMAGELAGQLASGCSCPVCGSASHPAPARAEVNGIGRADEDEARKILDDAEFEVQARQVRLATLEGELASLDERLGDLDRSALPAELAAARDDVERLEPLVAALDVLVERESACRAQLRAAETEHRNALLARAELRVEADQVSELITSIDTEWSALLSARGAAPDEDPTLDLDTVVRLRRTAAQALESAAGDLAASSVAEMHAAQLRGQLDHEAARAGFATAELALAALLEPDQVINIETDLNHAELAAHAARLTLADPEVAGALLGAAPTLADLRLEQRRATARARATASELAAAEARSSRLVELSSQLSDRLRRWAPLREQHRIVAELSAFVEGKGMDNPQRMRLAAYVLAERLRQVVAAANERLASMSDQRYALEHSDDRGYGEQRGGLSLRIRDDWNGVHRDPATLSGGETFVVSLALALGLADTVAHEAGGTDIDTLFIDEGFGSLDAETLEDVMDTLDKLRDGGRVVGLVSHVPELRSRITTQLEVTKGRAGSTLAAAVSNG